MTTSEPSRLDRLEALAETILLAIQQQQGQISQQLEQMSELRSSVQDTVQMVGSLGSEIAEDRRLILEMQSEVKGLQTENRRILEVLQQQREGKE